MRRTYGHPEGWAKKAMALHGKADDLSEAVHRLRVYIDVLESAEPLVIDWPDGTAP